MNRSFLLMVRVLSTVLACVVLTGPDVCAQWEKYLTPVVVRAGGGVVTLVEEQYSRPHLGIADQYQDGKQKILLLAVGDERVIIKAQNGQYVVLGKDRLQATASDSASAEVFTVMPVDGENFMLRSRDGRYIVLYGNPKSRLVPSDEGATGDTFSIDSYGVTLEELSSQVRHWKAKESFAKRSYGPACSYYRRVPNERWTAQDSANYATANLESYNAVGDAWMFSAAAVERYVIGRIGSENYQPVMSILCSRETGHYTDATWRKLASYSYNDGKQDRAISLLQRGLADHPASDSIAIDLAEMLVKGEKYAEVVTLLNRRARLTTTSRDAAHMLVYSYRKLKNEPEAIVRLAQLIASDSSDTWSYGQLMLALKNENRMAEAVAVARAAKSREQEGSDPWGRATTRVILAQSALESKKYAEGLRLVEEGLSLYVDDVELLVLRGNLLAGSGKREEACVTYSRVLELDSTYSTDRFDGWQRFGCAKSISASKAKQVDTDLSVAAAHVNTIESHVERWRKGVLSARNDLAGAAGQNEQVWQRLKSQQGTMTGAQKSRYQGLMDRLEIALRAAQTLAR